MHIPILYYPANQDVMHEFKIVGLYKYKRWDFSANWIFRNRKTIYSSFWCLYSHTAWMVQLRISFTVTSKNSVRLPDYHRFDVSATYKLLMGNKADKKRRELGSVSFSLFNLYNRTNVWYKQFTIEDGKIIETKYKLSRNNTEYNSLIKTKIE